MSSQNQGRESPPAEKQSDAQKAAPSSGQGVSDKPNTEQSAKDQLKGLESNPKGPMENYLEEKFAKGFPQKKY
ncbi:hypothetical protein V501_05979 [Pseudogymnoascus sp. VKM F-4519 (FW-2642)]|uniref:Uncharacterized protein n=1 Tax=Pseudogymnoascus verrucosus TaxID=342668 RepID=A0A2P2SX87_9PEZI|nr:uncharacterized protein VE01_00889 [Pseudogymnoascus verrucosus]KFY71125.1 hypothetical protein V499_08650 [Pseudogymnoascus sp. VKM F-103]KFZ08394.1 hypothetical protein V501_05979 [Pseudogymnoascus sp. VKM F-4519 (FW-2642)]OBT56963.1 hypothetical protein VE04_02653 [Pseudogymnoascus sp. 24MN13]OBU00882.1 hypothetical protein VE01_00889 [Pseudogymnoascus verrucosus]